MQVNAMKEATTKQLANAAISLLSHAPEKHIGRLLGLLERIAPDEYNKDIMRSIRQGWETDQR